MRPPVSLPPPSDLIRYEQLLKAVKELPQMHVEYYHTASEYSGSLESLTKLLWKGWSPVFGNASEPPDWFPASVRHVWTSNIRKTLQKKPPSFHFASFMASQYNIIIYKAMVTNGWKQVGAIDHFGLDRGAIPRAPTGPLPESKDNGLLAYRTDEVVVITYAPPPPRCQLPLDMCALQS